MKLSYSLIEDIIGWSFYLSGFISLFMHSWFPFLIGVGLVVMFYVFQDDIKDLFKKIEKCPHGIRGGLSQKKCQQCKDDIQKLVIMRQKKAEEEMRQQFENQRLIDIRERAKTIEREERKALSQSRIASIDNLISLSPQEFEDVVAIMYDRLGYEVTQTPYSNDRGKDAILNKDGIKYLVECKRYARGKKIGRPYLQKFYAAIAEEKASKGFFVTTSEFADTAYEYAPQFQIELVDGFQLVTLMNQAFPSQETIKSIKVMCLECGEIVHFPVSDCISDRKCRNGHVVKCGINPNKISPTLLKREFIQSFNDKAKNGDTQKCPRCGRVLRIRTGRRGKFWSCTGYPGCRYTKDYRHR